MRFEPDYFKAFMILLIIEICIATFVKGGFIRHTLGDFLVVIMLYCFIMSIFKIKSLIAAWIVLIFATMVELGQYFRVTELLQLNSNPLAVTVFGNAFSYSDLIAYLLGIITVIIIEQKRGKRLL